MQPTISTIVDNCETLWTKYQTALGNLGDATSGVPPIGETPEQKTEREKTEGDLTTAKDNAYEAWQAEASRYDTPYDTWDDAYEAAVSGLRKANDDGVKDSFWDNALPFIEGALQVLAVVGLILAVAALIIGGPILAALAAVAALLTLAFTIWKVAAGRGNGWDIVVAAIGVIPFGRLAKLGSVFRGGTPFGTFMKGFGSDMIGLTGFLQRSGANRLPALIARPGAITNARGGVTQSQTIIQNVTNLGDDIADLGTFGGFSLRPSVIGNRIIGGSGADMSTGMANAFANYNNNAVVRVASIMDGAGSPIAGMQNAASGADNVFNVIDTIVKPGGSEIYDQMQPDYDVPNDSWAKQLANS